MQTYLELVFTCITSNNHVTRATLLISLSFVIVHNIVNMYNHFNLDMHISYTCMHI